MAIRLSRHNLRRFFDLAASAVRRYRASTAAQPLGVLGERAAGRYLRRRGHRIVAHRARDRLGEIDLVTVQERVVVFVEVKTRRSLHGGDPGEAVDHKKQARITRAAISFLRRHDLLDCQVRFDVVSVLWPDGARRPQFEHIESAFEPDSRWQMHA